MNVRSVGAVAAGVMAVLGLTTQAVPARPHPALLHPAAPRPAALTCEVGTPPGSAPAFVPALTLMPAKVTLRGALWLSGCRGSHHRLRSAWITLRAAGQASCAGARGLRGTATITWYDAAGRPVGSSSLRTGGADLPERAPGGGLLTGTVTSGPLAGKRAQGGITPPDTVLTCAVRGTGAISGAGRVTFG